MGGYFKKGDTECAFDVFDQMESVNIVPIDFTFNTIINGLCKVGHTSEANRKGDVEELC